MISFSSNDGTTSNPKHTSSPGASNTNGLLRRNNTHRKTFLNGSLSTADNTATFLPLHNHPFGNSNSNSNSNNNKTTTTTNNRRIKRSRGKASTTLLGSRGMKLLVLLVVMCMLVLMVLPPGTWGGGVSTRTLNHRASSRQLRQDVQNKNDDINVIYDIAIVGSGPAGLTAALFASRAGLNVLALGSSTGLLSETKNLDNFPSFINNGAGGGGSAWLQTTKQQAVDFGAHFAPPGLLVTSLRRQEQQVVDNRSSAASFFELTTSMDTYKAWSVIIASGAKPRQLHLAGEEELWGTSLHSCAICDGHLYKDQVVLVVGGGDAAMDASILLSRHASKVLVVHRRNEFSGQNQVSRQVAQSTWNIEFFTPFVVTEWIKAKGDSSALVGAKIQNVESQKEETLEISGAFVMIGATANTDWLKSPSSTMSIVQLDKGGLIELLPVGKNNHAVTQSTTPGIFACGEVTDSVYRQAVTASAAGAQAAIDAERWLRETIGVRPHPLSQHVTDSSERLTAVEPSARVAEQGMPVNTENVPIKKEESDDCDVTKQDCITAIVQKYRVVVFSKPWCPYCRKALEALSLAGIANPHVIDLSTRDNSVMIQSTLKQMTGRRTVPNVFVGGLSIGGGDETAGLQRSGRLVPLLQERGALPARPLSYANEKGVSVNGREFCNLLEKSCFEAILRKFPAVIFSLSWCPECHRELELLERIGVRDKVHIIDLDDYKPISQDIRRHLLESTGRRQVPNLFVGEEYIGGFDRTSQIHEQGELVPKFKKVGLL